MQRRARKPKPNIETSVKSWAELRRTALILKCHDYSYFSKILRAHLNGPSRPKAGASSTHSKRWREVLRRMTLFPLDCAWRFAGQIEAEPIDAFDFVDDPGGEGLQQV